MPEPDFCTARHGVPRDGIPRDRKFAAFDGASIVDPGESGRVSRGS